MKESQSYAVTFGVTSRAVQEIDVTLRSSEAVMYYLGEIARVELHRSPDKDHGTDSDGCREAAIVSFPTDTNRHRATLFAMTNRIAPTTTPIFTTQYEGNNYYVPQCNDSRSDQIMSILTQLIDLNKSAKDVPASNVVTLVGR